MCDVIPQAAFDGGNEMLHLRKFFQPGQFRNLDGTIFADPAKIVSQQVGDHHQFGEFLGTGLQFVGELGVARGVGITRARAFDGRVTMCAPLMRRNCSGDDDAISKSPQSRNAENGAGETALIFGKIPSRTNRTAP